MAKYIRSLSIHCDVTSDRHTQLVFANPHLWEDIVFVNVNSFDI